mgnify:CR=1 FL=1
MLAVILIHVTSTYIAAESHITFLGMNLALFLNQAARFCVPLFLFLSGYSLGIGDRPMPYGAFLKRRASRVLAPYLVWVLVYEWSNCGFDPGVWLEQLGDLTGQLRNFLAGQAAPHLYFIPIVVQGYVLYPLLKGWVRRAPVQSALWSMAVTFLCQGWYVLHTIGLLPALPNPYLWLTFPPGAFDFVAGMCFAAGGFCENHPPVPEHAQGHPGVRGAVCGGCTARLQQDRDAPRHPPGPDGLCPADVLLGDRAWEKLKRVPFLERGTALLSRYSMGIYYNHVLVLCFLRQFPRFQLGMSGMLLLFLATFGLSLLVAVLLEGGWHGLKRAWQSRRTT